MKITTVGVDLAKNLFQVHAINDAGEVIVRRSLRRRQMMPFFGKLEPCLIGGEPTGQPVGWYGDAVAVAKRDMGGGDTLDGEGGTTVWGRLMPAADSQAMGALPIGLAQGVKLVRPVREDAVLTWGDVAIDETDAAVRMRREMESVFAVESPKATE